MNFNDNSVISLAVDESMFDEKDPRSLINLVPGYVSSAIRLIPNELFEMPLSELKKHSAIKPDDNLLRLNFWLEYDRAQRANRDMIMSNVYGGVLHDRAFRYLFSNSFRTLFIISPPVSYEAKLHDLIQIAMEAEEEILRMPIRNNDGSINNAVLVSKQKIANDVKNRVMGMPVHRSINMGYNKNVNTHEQIGEGRPAGILAVDQIPQAEIDQRLQQLLNEQNKSIDIDKDVHVIEATTTKPNR